MELRPRFCGEPWLLVQAVTHKRSEVPSLLTLSALFCTLMKINISLRNSFQISIISLHCDGWKRQSGKHPSTWQSMRLLLVCCVTDVDLSPFLIFFVLWGSFPRQVNERVFKSTLVSELLWSHFYQQKN